MIKLNLNAPQIDETKVISPHSIGIWFTQAHSCQRDLVLAAKQMRSDFPIHIIASHQDLLTGYPNYQKPQMLFFLIFW